MIKFYTRGVYIVLYLIAAFRFCSQDVIRFWLDRGIDGFRVDAVPHLCEDIRFPDEPLTGNPNPNDYGYTHKIYTKDQPRTYDMVRGWREVLDKYPGDKVMMIEGYANISMTMKYYHYGAHFPFNFGLITDTNKDAIAADFKRLIDRWMDNMPKGATANWVVSNRAEETSSDISGIPSGHHRPIRLLTLSG